MLGSELGTSERMHASGKISNSPEDSHNSMDFRKIIALIGASYFLIMTAYVVPIACVITMLLVMPLRFINIPFFIKVESRLCKMVNDHWVATAYYCGIQENLQNYANKKCLLIANHLGLVDHFLIMTSLHDKGDVSGKWMWVIYNIWKYTPLGAMWTIHGNFFVNGGPDKRELLLRTFKSHLKNCFSKFDWGWIIMYPEGSRLYLIRNAGKRFAEKLGLPPLRHCVYPRSGAAHAVVDQLAPSKENTAIARCGSGVPIEYVIDATLGYPKGDVVDLGSAMLGDFPHNNPNLAIHYDVVKVDQAWADETKLQEWLYARYQKKDELLDEYYKTGHFPGKRREMVNVPTSTMIFSQVFWIALYYIHHIIWVVPLTNLAMSSIYHCFT